MHAYCTHSYHDEILNFSGVERTNTVIKPQLTDCQGLSPPIFGLIPCYFSLVVFLSLIPRIRCSPDTRLVRTYIRCTDPNPHTNPRCLHLGLFCLSRIAAEMHFRLAFAKLSFFYVARVLFGICKLAPISWDVYTSALSFNSIIFCVPQPFASLCITTLHSSAWLHSLYRRSAWLHSVCTNLQRRSPAMLVLCKLQYYYP